MVTRIPRYRFLVVALLLLFGSLGPLAWHLFRCEPLSLLQTAPKSLRSLALWWLYLYEPTYNEKKLSEWLQGYDTDNGGPQWRAADNAVREIGCEALPYLLLEANVTHDPSPWIYEANRWLKRIHLPQFHLQSAEQRRRKAGLAFCALRSHPQQVVKALTAIYLSARGPDSWAYQCSALDGLSRLGPSAKEAVPFLLAEGACTNTQVRQGVFKALGMIHAEAESVVPVLLNALQDSDIDVRSSAARALGEFGPMARQAVPALQSCLDKETQILKSSPSSLQHRMAKGAIEAALSSINETLSAPHSIGALEDSRRQWTLPAQTTSSPLDKLATSLAYKYVAATQMLTEANYCSQKLRLCAKLPIEEDDIRQAYVSPPKLLRALGSKN